MKNKAVGNPCGLFIVKLDFFMVTSTLDVNMSKKKKSAKKIIKKRLVLKKHRKVLVKKKNVSKKPKKALTVKKKKSGSIVKIHKKLIRKRLKKTQNEFSSFPAEAFFKAKIKVIGIGGGGGSIVSEIGRSLGKATFVIADTDIRAFKKRRGIKYFLFGQELTHGLGTGLNPELARSAAEQEKEKIASLFKDQDIVIFVASLGGGLGSGATQVFAEASKSFGGISFGIFTLPFKFEGKNKYRIAYKALKELRKSLNVSITIPNERIFKIINADTAITEAFSIVNKNLIESLESLIDLIYNPGVINIDFADLRAILRGRGNLAFLNTSEATGNDKSEKIIQSILHNPLYQNNNFNVEKVLFNIEGGGGLSMYEVDKISRTIADQNPKAKIIFGISKNAKYKNKIKTTLLMTGPVAGAEVADISNVLLVPEKSKDKVSQKVPKKSVKKDRKAILPVRSGKHIKGNKTNKKAKKIIKSKEKKTEEMVPINNLPVFDSFSAQSQSVGNLTMASEIESSKKSIRRSALEIKKEQEIEENKKSKQEEEWEIPAFLRFKK